MPGFGQFSSSYQIATDFLRRLVANNGDGYGACEVTIPIAIPDAVTGDIDTVLPDKFEVVDVTCIKQGGAGAGNTMQVQTGAGVVISDAIACAVDKTVTRAGTIDPASSTIAAGGTLRIHAVKAAGTRTALVLVYGFIRP